MTQLENYDDFTLYEVFYETGTELGGVYSALEDKYENNPVKFHEIQQQHIQLNKDREHVLKSDRESQIRLIKEWDTRRAALEAELNGVQ
ncbi:hypothetical protein [Bifidobacterium callitrichidarum]|uniref:Uncharacterized protein n=1 Tax=Bifidobacterium callitrichidarum TaxID=2052941 RepID=A0A2U2N0M5_9BIFI|nr:hypothetical protein [Bifidobacterium callitrichidarum]PWG62670.1 hypothetical protein DF196_11975 [Bifidobacterium callitrichidarum]